jgi:phosphatidate cytidylyltransferase
MQNLGSRLITAAVLIPLTVWVVLALPTAQLGAILAVFVLLGAWEWSALMGLRGRAARALYCAVVALALVGAAGLVTLPGGVLALLAVAALWWAGTLYWLQRHAAAGSADSDAARAAKGLAGILTLVPAWAALVVVHGGVAGGAYWLLLLLVLIWVADTGAYFAGRRWGRIKLAPRISPGKTREGVYGALAAAALVALAGGAALGLTIGQLVGFILIGLVTVAFSVVGDLFESMMKRHRGVKDSGTLFPGHGGVLDRVDSLTAAAPVFLLGLYLLGVAA